MSSQLEQLKKLTTVVVDTGDIDSISEYSPQDATTNPSLILQAAKDPKYEKLIDEAVAYGKAHSKGKSSAEVLALIVNKVSVNFGLEILKHIPGYVSTEVDARLSFNTAETVARAKHIISLYESSNVNRSRILIKIAATWEGIVAAKQLKADNINCNLTLLFSFAQAVACAEAGVKLISPFVGRIRDWHLANTQNEAEKKAMVGPNDPGVKSVTKIYNYYKKYGYQTIVMGASFRTKDEILELAGCDRLTIAPKWLTELSATVSPIQPKLSIQTAKTLIPNETVDERKPELTEERFRWELNEDAMATEKLAEGIRTFAKDISTLEKMILKKLNA